MVLGALAAARLPQPPTGMGRDHALGVALMALFLCVLNAAAASAQVRRVVVLFDERIELPGMAVLDASLTRTLRSSGSKVEIYREEMDLSRFDAPGYRSALRDHLRRKYADKAIDVLVAVMAPSLDFVLEHAETIFPETPIVFCGLDRRDLAGRELPPHATGVFVTREFRTTLDLALRLHPGTKRAVVVSGTLDFDRRLLEQVRDEFRPFEDRVQITYLTDRPMDALLRDLASLPPETIVLYSTLFRDGAGAAFVPHEAVERVTAAANAPVYAFVDQYLGRGVVGGHMYSLRTHGEAAGRLAMQVLAGTAPASLPPVDGGDRAPMFDWRQLQRWDIDPSRLPADAQVSFRRETAWEQYRWFIVGAIAIAAVQAMMIAALAIERLRRRRGEKRYEVATTAGAAGVWEWNPETNELYVDPAIKARLGYTGHELGNHLDDWIPLIHPDDLRVAMNCSQELFDGMRSSYEVEQRLRHRDGSTRWFLARGSAVFRNGRPSRVTGTTIDITDRKLADQALHDMQARLTRVSRLAALGEFAATIAHEVRQPLTTIALNARACDRSLSGPAPDMTEVHAALAEIQTAASRANEVIQRNRELFRQHTVRKEPLDINTVIREVTVLAGARLQSGQVTLVTSLATGLPPIAGDRIELQQVLLNLIVNAVDATEHIAPGTRNIDISTAATPAGGVKVTVADNGIGLEGVDMRRLFTLSYTTKPSGTGIGLSLSRSIVQAHGGRLWAEPNPAGGAMFSFTLPPTAAAPATPHQPDFVRT